MQVLGLGGVVAVTIDDHDNFAIGLCDGDATGRGAIVKPGPGSHRRTQLMSPPRRVRHVIDGSSLPMTTLRFRAQIETNKINPYVLVDARRAARLQKNWRKPMPVCIQVNGKPDQPWRINMMPIGDGSFYLYLHGAVRKAAGAQVGDRVRVEMEFDPAYKNGPQHRMPGWFKKALAGNPQAMKN